MNWKFWTWPAQIRELKRLLRQANLDYQEELQRRIELEEEHAQHVALRQNVKC